MATTEATLQANAVVPDYVEDELAHYREQIKKYQAGELDETKMQKQRLHFGTYAQRQEGVQMQRIKIPGGILRADQLARLADAADKFGSGFIHFTTREDAQLYYVQLSEVPELLRFLAEAGITTREACGNTVRNITACYRAGTSPTEAFDVLPYAEALFHYLVRNKYNQNLGRKFKITFEGCAEDHSRLRVHDIGFWAVTRQVDGVVQRGFKVFLGGGLGGTPSLAHLYTDFLPAEELFNLAASVLRLFDRYGERKARMKARMKFLIQSLGWETFLTALETERELVGPIPLPVTLLSPDDSRTTLRPTNGLRVLKPLVSDPRFQDWARDSVAEHKLEGFRGVTVRLKLGDITSDRARQLAEVVRQFSSDELRITIEQNAYLPWVREEDLPDLYLALQEISLSENGSGTITDITTCPGSDTCRLGIASAKGLGNAISEGFDSSLAEFRELARSLQIKISGCPNGCAQHSIVDIGFHAAALTHDGRSVPAHLLFLGGRSRPDDAQFGSVVGKYPAKNSVKVVETLLEFYRRERSRDEEFVAFANRVGKDRFRQLLEPLRALPDFNADPSFYQDYGHENERFAVRQGVKGECAGATVAETVPTLEKADEWLAQAQAYTYHHEYENAAIASYEAAAAAARVPLYRGLVDPFTADEALWEFENLFVLSGQTEGRWQDLSSRLHALKVSGKDEASAQKVFDEAREFVRYCRETTLPEST
jgi:sulfite reductase (ferredoxin)